MKRIYHHLLLGVALAALLNTTPVLAGEAGPNILFVLDSSGSMMESLEGKNKLETAKGVLSALVGDLPPDINVGLEVYGHRKGECDDIEMVFPVGKLNVAALRQKIASLQAGGKTPIATSLEKAAGELRGLKGNSTIVLISDGQETCDGDPVGIAELIKNEFGIDVVIHVVGFAVDDAVRQQLSKIARAGGGNYYAANNAQQLKESLVEIKEKAVEPAREFFVEEFDGPSFSESWIIINDDPNGRVLDEGKFVISTPSGDIHKETVKNILLYQKEVPTGKKYAVTTEFSTSLLATYAYNGYSDSLMNGQVSGLVFYADKDNYIIFVVGRAGNQAQAILWKRQGGKRDVTISSNFKELKNPDTYLLKMERRKYKYTGYYYDPEAEKGKGGWKKIGTVTMMGKNLQPGLIAYRGRDAAEVVTEFDSFKITELQE
ncbi:MAG: VWA domain-containing protein [Candidatus Brocadiales bacterium]